MHTLTELAAESPESVRVREGFSHKSCWAEPRRRRPTALTRLHGRPDLTEV